MYTGQSKVKNGQGPVENNPQKSLKVFTQGCDLMTRASVENSVC